MRRGLHQVLLLQVLLWPLGRVHLAQQHQAIDFLADNAFELDADFPMDLASRPKRGRVLSER